MTRRAQFPIPHGRPLPTIYTFRNVFWVCRRHTHTHTGSLACTRNMSCETVFGTSQESQLKPLVLKASLSKLDVSEFAVSSSVSCLEHHQAAVPSPLSPVLPVRDQSEFPQLFH